MLISLAPLGSVADAWKITGDHAYSKLVPDLNLERQAREFVIKRYWAYFRGWCQVFGEHECILVGEHDKCWLIGENKIGLILPKPLVRQLNSEILLHERLPVITFAQQGVQFGALHFPFRSALEKHVMSAIEQLIDSGEELHLFLTSHLLYGNGRRIITISNKRPQPIIYKEIGSLKIQLQ